MTQPQAPAGWFPDPSDPSRLRYFDGKLWTEQYANFGVPLPAPPNTVQPPKAGMSRGMKVMIALAAVFFGLWAIGHNSSTDRSVSSKSSSTTRAASASDSSNSSAAEVPAPAGSAVRDGKFEFRVLGVERSPSKAGVFNPEPAKGEFFIVNLEVTNIGDEARSFSASSQKLIVNGNQYDSSSSLSDKNWMEDINPGLSINAKVYFDIPKGKVPTAIECHDSMFSGGALLAL